MPSVGDKIRIEIDRKLMNVGLVGDYNGMPIRITEGEFGGEVGEEVLVRIREHKGGYARGIILKNYTSSPELSGNQKTKSELSSDDQTVKERASQSPSEEQKERETEEDNDGAEQYRETAINPSDTEIDIDHLREKAEKSAVDEVSEDFSTTTTEKPQYNRSTEVKEYVKARADGVCEGCGEPAPFTSKTSEPYLHTHHIFELSDGGSDTPDTVVALCPNCHYRVHHGEDGDDYNQELLEIVQEKESANDD